MHLAHALVIYHRALRVTISVSLPLSASSRHHRLQHFSTECLKSFILICFIFLFKGLKCFPSDDRATLLHTEIFKRHDRHRGMVGGWSIEHVYMEKRLFFSEKKPEAVFAGDMKS